MAPTILHVVGVGHVITSLRQSGDGRLSPKLRTFPLAVVKHASTNGRLLGIPSAIAPAVRGIGKRFVYILRSESDSDRHYVGLTANVDERLEWRNHGPSRQTVMHRVCSDF